MGYIKFVLSFEEAKTIAERCLQEVAKIPGEPVAVSIVDERGDPVYCLRMDNVKPICLDLAECKAYTAAVGELSSADFGKRDRGWSRELANYHDDKFTHIAGGVPIQILDIASNSPITVGGVGVSGRMPDADEAIARSGLLSFKA
jgi:glc operon protein GlcG